MILSSLHSDLLRTCIGYAMILLTSQEYPIAQNNPPILDLWRLGLGID